MFGAESAIRPDIPHQRAGSQGFSLRLLAMDVVDAEGPDSGPVGEDGTCGKERIVRNVQQRHPGTKWK